MSTYFTVTFPEDITDAYIEVTSSSIYGNSYIYFTSDVDPLLLDYITQTTTIKLDKIEGDTLASSLYLNKPINCIRFCKIDNYVKIYMSGLLVTVDNAICISEYIKLMIPNSSDPKIAYRHVFSFAGYQGTFFINYIFEGTNFTIISMYFTFTRNPYLTQGTKSVTSISL